MTETHHISLEYDKVVPVVEDKKMLIFLFLWQVLGSTVSP
jgi:hypothetical protein